MPRSINELLSASIGSIGLNILVFGPQVHTLSADERQRNLQLKRAQIKEELESLGHNVKYAEDLVAPGINAFLQEILIMREYDLIVTLVGSPGSNAEVGIIASRPEIAEKAQLFMDATHTEGLVAEACRNAQAWGAYYKEYEYPKDLVECHLLGFTLERVSSTQAKKYLL